VRGACKGDKKKMETRIQKILDSCKGGGEALREKREGKVHSAGELHLKEKGRRRRGREGQQRPKNVDQ